MPVTEELNARWHLPGWWNDGCRSPFGWLQVIASLRCRLDIVAGPYGTPSSYLHHEPEGKIL